MTKNKLIATAIAVAYVLWIISQNVLQKMGFVFLGNIMSTIIPICLITWIMYLCILGLLGED